MNLLKIIDSYLLAEEDRLSTNHHPSSLNSCSRKIYYRMVNEPKSNPVDAGAMLKMKIGDSIHDLISDMLKSAGLDIIPEIEFKFQFAGIKNPMSGRVDNIFMDDGIMAGIEVKTSFGKGIIEIANTKSPKEEHVMQVLTYLYCTNINRFYLLYIARDISFKCQFMFEYKKNGFYMIDGNDDRLIMAETDYEQYVINKLTAIEKAVEDKNPPKREFNVAINNGEIKEYFQRQGVKYKSDWQCIYCQWCDACWQEEKVKYANGNNYEEVMPRLRNDG